MGADMKENFMNLLKYIILVFYLKNYFNSIVNSLILLVWAYKSVFFTY